MATLFRTAKSGCNWDDNELLAYNIKVTTHRSQTFFGSELPPLLDLDPLLISGTPGLSDQTLRLLQYFDLAPEANVGQESATDDVAKETLRLLRTEHYSEADSHSVQYLWTIVRLKQTFVLFTDVASYC